MNYRLRTQADYNKAINVVKMVIHEWDPYSLLKDGAPDDEFDGEIERIVAQIRHIQSENDAINLISGVFWLLF